MIDWLIDWLIDSWKDIRCIKSQKGQGNTEIQESRQYHWQLQRRTFVKEKRLPTQTTPTNSPLTFSSESSSPLQEWSGLCGQIFTNENLLVKHCYRTHLLFIAIEIAISVSRTDTFKSPEQQNSTNKIPLVGTFPPFNYEFRDNIIPNCNILYSKTWDIFACNPLVSFGRNRSIWNVSTFSWNKIDHYQQVLFLALVPAATPVLFPQFHHPKIWI